MKGGDKVVTKISEITIKDIADYIRLDDYVESEIETYLNIAKNYISNYTGIQEQGEGETLDDYADLVIVVYILCQDMHDNRTMYVDSGNINKVVQTILDMHTGNNLC